MARAVTLAGAAIFAAMVGQTTAEAAGLSLEGSFGEGGFDRYVPPITNPVFNETPFITTEVKPFYAYHSIPSSFVTDGGHVSVAGLQARVAITDRLGFIATTDGYSWLNFDNALADTDGWNDFAIGLKYAIISKPEAGGILTAGLRYTIPVGDIEIDELSLDLNGIGAGYVNPFITAAKIVDKFQFQGMFGAQIALDEGATTSLLASGHIDYEIAPGWYPTLEYNLFIPIDGGDRIPGSNLTGAEIFDFGSSDPETIVTVGGGLRYRLTEHALIGVGADINTLRDSDDVYGWRVLTDLVLHF